MKSLFPFIRTTLTGGILFLLPMVLLTMIIGRAYNLLIKLSAPLAEKMPALILGLDGSNLLAILLIVLICFVGGIMFRSKRIRRWISSLEGGILAYLPGYSMLKSIASDVVGHSDHNMTSVLVKDDDTWSIGFLVEEGRQYCTVFIPEAPRHDSGEVKIVPAAWIKKVNVGANKTALSLKLYGKGALAHIESGQLAQ